MKKILLSLCLTLLTIGSAFGQFNPSQPYATVNNACGAIYYLQGSTYYDPHGNSYGSLPPCNPPSPNAPGGAAGGDLSGTYPNPTVSSVGGVAIGTMATQNASGVAITGGTINGVSAGGTTPLIGLVVGSTVGVQWGTNAFLFSDAANMLSLRNGTNAQAFEAYNTYTDGSNYERGFFKFSGNVLEIGTEQAGTGLSRQINFLTNNVTRWAISGPLLPGTDNANDIGSSTLHVRTYYGAGSLVIGTSTKTGAYTATANDYTIRSDGTSGAFTVTLESAPVTGQIHIVKKIDSTANAITVSGNGKNIDGAASVPLTTQYQSVRVQFNGTTWDVI